MSEKPVEILMSSGISAKTRKPFIDYRWGDKHTQFTPEEARAHARLLLECAEAAIMDCAVCDFLTTKLEQPLERAVVMIAELREFRVDMRESTDKRG